MVRLACMSTMEKYNHYMTIWLSPAKLCPATLSALRSKCQEGLDFV